MKNIISKKMSTIGLSGIRKMNEKALAMERAGQTVIHFEIGRPDFDTPEYIKKAAYESLERGEVFYTSNLGDMGLREQIAKKLHYQNNIPCKAENIMVSVGLSEAIFDALMAVLDPGDEILVPDPVWMNYVNVPKVLGAVPVSYTLKEENGYQMDLEEIREKITDKTKVLVLVTPNNPTGSMLSRETLEGLAKIAIEKDIVIFADEVYERLVYGDQEHVSIASLPGMQERTVLVNGFSKAYAMTGWRLGYACGPDWLMQQMTKIHQYAIMCAPTTSQYAAVEALKNGDDDVAMMRDSYNERRRFVLHTLRAMGLPCFEAQGAFYVFPDIREFGMSSDDFATRLLQEEKVAIVPGTAFGDCGEGFLRISYAYSLDNLKAALSRLEKFVTRLRAQ